MFSMKQWRGVASRTIHSQQNVIVGAQLEQKKIIVFCFFRYCYCCIEQYAGSLIVISCTIPFMSFMFHRTTDNDDQSLYDRYVDSRRLFTTHKILVINRTNRFLSWIELKLTARRRALVFCIRNECVLIFHVGSATDLLCCRGHAAK